MNLRLVNFIVIGLVLSVLGASASVLYVDVNSANPLPPYRNLSTAAVSIQDAVDAAANGDVILVNDGVYQTGSRATKQSLAPLPSSTYDTNRVVISKPVTVQSLNGPSAAYIDGGGIYRCVFLTNGATLSGFTLQNGAVGWVQTTVVLGRTITKTNLAYGGGVAGVIPGNYLGVVSNCVLTANTATGYGGGASDVTLINCTLTGNNAITGGGAFGCSLNNCTVNGNSAQTSVSAGTFPFPPHPTTIVPGVGGGIYSGSACNCLIENNNAFDGGGTYQVFGLINCTIVNNNASFAGGVDAATTESGVYFGLTNCILYGNYAGTNANYGSGNLAFNYCCLTPKPTGGIANFTNDPAFEDYWGGDFHLQSDSPCINGGCNHAVNSAFDLDGNPRVVGGTVDVGCYEFQSPTSVLGYLWAQQYGLPTDGSADYIDSDGDGMNNWQEFVAGTNPTNAASVLTMTYAVPDNYLNWVIVKWQSVSTRYYFLQRTSNLGVAGFTTIATDIAGQDGTTIYFDATATNSSSYFYRVGVQ